MNKVAAAVSDSHIVDSEGAGGRGQVRKTGRVLP